MGDSSPSTVTQTSKTELGPEQKEVYGAAKPYITQYASTPLQQYQGSGVVGFNPLQQQAQQQYLDQAGTVGNLASQAASSQQMLLDPSFQLDVANNPYLRAATEALTGQVTDNLTTSILPSLRSGATQAGGMYSGASSKSGIAEGTAVGKTNQGLSDSIAKMMLDAYTGGRASLQQAVSQNPGVQAQQLLAPGIIEGVGGQQQALAQSQLDEQIRNFYTEQKLPLLQAQELMSLVQATPGGSATSTATGATPQANPYLQDGGILAALLGLV